MKTQVLMGFEWIHLSIFALLLFLVLFIGVLYWVSRKDNRKVYKDLSELPLGDGGVK